MVIKIIVPGLPTAYGEKKIKNVPTASKYLYPTYLELIRMNTMEFILLHLGTHRLMGSPDPCPQRMFRECSMGMAYCVNGWLYRGSRNE
jgi:hypothetical protein